MKDTFGLIYTSQSDMCLRELTRSRSIAAMPFGGRYRVIDVLLSNMVHSGVTNVGLITQRNYHSLMDHLGSGKEWDLDRKRDGPIHPAALRHQGQHRRLHRSAGRPALQHRLHPPFRPKVRGDFRLRHRVQHHL